MPPPQHGPHARWNLEWIAVAAAVAFSCVALVFQLLPRNEEIVLRVVGSGGEPIERVNVYLDEQCRASIRSSTETTTSFQQPSGNAPPAQILDLDAQPPPAARPTQVLDIDAYEPPAAKPTQVLDIDAYEPPASIDAKPSKSKPPPEPQAGRAPKPRVTRTRADRSTSSTQKKSPEPATLNIQSRPKAAVLVDGRPIGKTPLVGVRVQPGKHSVVLVHPSQGRRRVVAQVAAGSRRSINIRF